MGTPILHLWKSKLAVILQNSWALSSKSGTLPSPVSCMYLSWDVHETVWGSKDVSSKNKETKTLSNQTDKMREWMDKLWHGHRLWLVHHWKYIHCVNQHALVFKCTGKGQKNASWRTHFAAIFIKFTHKPCPPPHRLFRNHAYHSEKKYTESWENEKGTWSLCPGWSDRQVAEVRKEKTHGVLLLIMFYLHVDGKFMSFFELLCFLSQVNMKRLKYIFKSITLNLNIYFKDVYFIAENWYSFLPN
jgi:hypothetical protein